MAISPDFDELAAAVLSATDSCDHADLRLVSTRTSLQTRRDRAARADLDGSERSLGVRVLQGGCWGFAATDDLSIPAATAAARAACTPAAEMVLARRPR